MATFRTRIAALLRTASMVLALLAALLPASLPAQADGVTFTALSAGAYHTCARTSTGEVMCWGENTYSQLGGNAGGNYSATPVTVANLSGVSAIDGGGLHTCAIGAGGAALCWGANGVGQLGNGANANSALPVAVSGLSSGVLVISAGANHTCAVTSAGGVKCWGHNAYGQLGNGTVTPSNTPVDVAGLSSGVVAVSAGSFHTCAVLSDGGVKCWGLNQSGQLGNNSVYQSDTPVDVLDLNAAIVFVSAGYGHTCAVSANGIGKCWGLHNEGQLGNADAYGGETPVDVDASLAGAFASIDASPWYHSCGVSTSGAAFCWGDNEFGALGNGGPDDSFVPVAVSGLGSGVLAVSTGSLHTCALIAAGGVKCWGHNSAGQLGDGSTTDSNTPVDVVLPSGNQDTEAPSIAITSPTAVTYLLNQAVTASYTCDDGAGSGVQTCAGTAADGAAVDTASAGSKTFTVNAVDNAGNFASQSVTYQVGYTFSGFLQPIDNPDTVNTGRAGRTYPVKWQLRDANGAAIGSLAAVSSLTYQPTACAAFGGAPSDPLTATATGGTVLRYDSAAQQYIYNWSTPSAPGCYTLFLTLDSGQVHPAHFQLR